MDAVTVEPALAETKTARPALLRDLGRQPYEPIWRAMQHFTDARDAHTPDELWVLENPNMY